MHLSKTSLVLDALEKKIRAGQFTPGEKLPSMRELAKSFQVSTMVMQQVAIALEKKSLLVRSSKCGLFIPPEMEQPNRPVIGVLTTIAPQFMDFYYEGLFASVNAVGGVVIPVLMGQENDIRNMLAQNPSKVLVDLEGACYELDQVNTLLRNVPVTFFNRYEWMTPLPKSAVLIDRVAQTVDTLRHFENHGHKRILFVGHYRKPRPYKQYELETAAKIVGLKLWTPEFQYVCFDEFDTNPAHIAKIFREEPPTAIFSRSDINLFHFMQKIRAFYPECGDAELIGCYNTKNSQIAQHEFSSYDMQWHHAWDVAIRKKTPGIDWCVPKLIVREKTQLY